MRWLRKAVLRYAGVIALHDEAAAYANKAETLRQARKTDRGWDMLAITTAFKIPCWKGLSQGLSQPIQP
jgi:uncharacterized membrane protein